MDEWKPSGIKLEIAIGSGFPARLSEKREIAADFFETKEQAEKFIFETKRSGSVELAELAVEEKHILGVIRQSQKYEPKLLLEAWQRFEKEEIVEDRNLTVQELVEKFVSRDIRRHDILNRTRIQKILARLKVLLIKVPL